MIVDIGGGTTEVAVISLGGIVVSQSLRVGGDEMDDAIVNHIKKEYKLLVGQQTAEEIKLEVGSGYRLPEEVQAEVRGRDMLTGLPKTVVISSEEVRRALDEPVSQIIDAIKSTLDKTPPELAADIMDRGIVLAGGGALLQGLDERLRHETQMPVHLAESPLTCVAVGSGRSLEEFEAIHRSERSRKRRNGSGASARGPADSRAPDGTRRRCSAGVRLKPDDRGRYNRTRAPSSHRTNGGAGRQRPASRHRQAPLPNDLRLQAARRGGGARVLALVLITFSFRKPDDGPLASAQSTAAAVLRPFTIAGRAGRAAVPRRLRLGRLARRGQRRAVGAGDGVVQRVGDARRCLLPARREAGLDRAVRREVDEGVVGEAVDFAGRHERGHVRIEVARVGRDDVREGAAVGEVALPGAAGSGRMRPGAHAATAVAVVTVPMASVTARRRVRRRRFCRSVVVVVAYAAIAALPLAHASAWSVTHLRAATLPPNRGPAQTQT